MAASAHAAIAGALPASIPSPPQEWASFSVGPLTIHAYALCILAGIVAAMWLTARRWDAKGGPEGVVWDICIWAIPFGIIGGRLYHIFSSPDAYFGPGFDGSGDLSLTWQIWRGGLGIWGAVALGAVGAWIGCRRYGVRLAAFADAAAPGLLLAQAIGRWGNWFNQELYGGPTTLPWGLEIDPGTAGFPPDALPGTLFHPTFLYEFLWNIAGVAILLLLDRRFRFRHGTMFWAYVSYYTLGRLWIEAMRIDDAEMITFFGVTQRLNVWTSLLLLVVSLTVFVVLLRRHRGEPDPGVYLPGRALAEQDAGQAAVAAGATATPAGAAQTAVPHASADAATTADPAPADAAAHPAREGADGDTADGLGDPSPAPRDRRP
ncbi:prolipoprotein diacylglyceryl transferase [Arthrobacter halodurans]|uniref:Phosphatidylglycerol--prolipoprotein diacylglyceryl transferase n=1 Tax=Arthrobacter halodurans TaxID=516699 RepID=A0ABV4UPH2_9MICC